MTRKPANHSPIIFLRLRGGRAGEAVLRILPSKLLLSLI